MKITLHFDQALHAVMSSRYYTLKHEEQARNPNRMESLSSGGRREKSDGLTSSNKVTEVIYWEEERLYTNITVRFKK